MFEGQKVFLDVRDYPFIEKLEVEIRHLGGTVEKFLSRETTCVITSRGKIGRENEHGLQDCSPSPKTGEISLSVPVCSSPDVDRLSCSTLSRGQKLLMRSNSFKHCVKSSGTICDPVQFAMTWNISVINIETVIKAIKSKNVQNRLPINDKCNNKATPLLTRKHASRKLIGPFLKIEDVNAQYRPFFSELPAFPCIRFDPDDGQSIFDTVRNYSKRSSGKQHVKEMKSKRVCKTPAVQRDGGYCECCDTYYQDLKKHLCEPVHKLFAENCGNYSSLDALMHELPSLDAFTSSLSVLNNCSLENGMIKSDTTEKLQSKSPISVHEVERVKETFVHEHNPTVEPVVEFKEQEKFYHVSQCDEDQSKSNVVLTEKENAASTPAISATLKVDKAESVGYLKESAVKSCTEDGSSLLHVTGMDIAKQDSVELTKFEKKSISWNNDANTVSDLQREERAKNYGNEGANPQVLIGEEFAFGDVEVLSIVPCSSVSIGALSGAENSNKETPDAKLCMSDDSELISSARVDGILAMLSSDHSDCVPDFCSGDTKFNSSIPCDETLAPVRTQLCVTSSANILKLDAAVIDLSKTCNKEMKSEGIAKPQLLQGCSGSQANVLPDDEANQLCNTEDQKPSVTSCAFESTEKSAFDCNNETFSHQEKNVEATYDGFIGVVVAASDQHSILQVSAEKNVSVDALAASRIHPNVNEASSLTKTLMVCEQDQKLNYCANLEVQEQTVEQSNEVHNDICDPSTVKTSLCHDSRDHDSSETSLTIDEGIEAVVDTGPSCLPLYFQPMLNSVAGILCSQITETDPVTEQNRATSVASVDSAVVTDDQFELGDHCSSLMTRSIQAPVILSQQNILSVSQPADDECVTSCVDNAHMVKMVSPTICYGNDSTNTMRTTSPIGYQENNSACTVEFTDKKAEEVDAVAQVTHSVALPDCGMTEFSDEGAVGNGDENFGSIVKGVVCASKNETMIDGRETVSSVTNMELDYDSNSVFDIVAHLMPQVAQPCDGKSEFDEAFSVSKMVTVKPTDDVSATKKCVHSAVESADCMAQDINENLLPVNDAADALSAMQDVMQVTATTTTGQDETNDNALSVMQDVMQITATTTGQDETSDRIVTELPCFRSVAQEDLQFNACPTSLATSVTVAACDLEAHSFTDLEEMDLSVEVHIPGVGAQLEMSANSADVQMQCSSGLDCSRLDVICVTPSFMATADDECDEMIVDPAVILSPRLISTPHIEDLEGHSKPVESVLRLSPVATLAVTVSQERSKFEAVSLEEIRVLSEKFDVISPATPKSADNGAKNCGKHNEEKRIVKCAGSQSMANDAKDIIQELEMLELLAARLVAGSTTELHGHGLRDGLASTVPQNSLHDTLLTLADQSSLFHNGIHVDCNPLLPADDVMDSNILDESNDDGECDLADLLEDCDNVMEIPSVVFDLPANLSYLQENELGISYGADNNKNTELTLQSPTFSTVKTAQQPIPAADSNINVNTRHSDANKDERLVDANSTSLASLSASDRSTFTDAPATYVCSIVSDGDAAFSAGALLPIAATQRVTKILKNPPCRAAAEAAETVVCVAHDVSATARDADGVHRIASPRPKTGCRVLTASRGDLAESFREPSCRLQLSSDSVSSPSLKSSFGIWKVESIVDLRVRLRRVMESQSIPAGVHTGTDHCREAAQWRVKGSSSTDLKLVVSKLEPSAPGLPRIC